MTRDDIGLKMLLGLLLLTANPGSAATGSPPASGPATYLTQDLPVEGRLRPDERKTLFIGNYGETLTFSDRWVLHPPQLNHGIEVVRFHSSWLKDRPAPRPVKESAFEHPASYTALNLAQLIVIPKENESFKALPALRDAKLADLAKEGVAYSTRGAPSPASDWPKETFQVFITSPYRLHQVFTRSDGNVFVLTDGLGSDADGAFVGTPAAEELISSFGASLERLNRAPESKHAETFDYSFSGSRWICLPLLGMGLLLWGLSTKQGIPRRLASAAIASAILAPALRIAGFFFARGLSGADSTPNTLILIGGASIVVAAAGLIYRSSRLPAIPKRVTQAAAIISAGLLALALIVIKQDIASDPQSSASKFSLFMFCIGLLDGAGLGFSSGAFGTTKSAGTAAILLLLLLGPGRAHAQESADVDRDEAARIVDSRDQPIQSDEYRARAIHQLESEGRVFNYPRVEISGIVATDDPNDFAPKMISLSLHPAHNSSDTDKPASGILQKVRKALKGFDNDRKDISDLFDDKTGSLTPRGREILAPIMGKNTHVNEIVAHSWGAILLNNAIRIGAINPPKKIIVIGVPDSDLLKWHQLAKYTGTNVEIFSNSWDMAQKVAHQVDTFKNLELMGKQEDYNQGKISREWAQWSQDHHRRAGGDALMKISYVDIPPAPWTAFGHGRADYYQELLRMGVLTKTDGDLLNEQEALIETRIKELREEAIDREVEEIRRTRPEAVEPAPDSSETSSPDDAPTETGNSGYASPLTPRFPLPAAPLPPQLAPAVRAPQDVRPLAGIAQRACRAPGSLTQDDMLGIYWYYEPGVDADRAGASLTGCEKFVFDQIIRSIRENRLNGYLSADYVKSLVNQLQSVQNPPPYQGGRRRGGDDDDRRGRADPCKRAYPGYCND